MATENTLRLRAIQPRVHPPRPPEPNGWRRLTRAEAKAAQVSRRRIVRRHRKAQS